MNGAKQSLGWFISVSRKFFRIAPINTLWVVLNTIVSQISNLLAFFLPLKIIILLATPRTPRYFPQSWADYDRDILILSLCMATLFFYLLYLLSEKFITLSTERGGTRLIARARKIMLFANQDKKAEQAYRRYTANIAGLVFILLCLAFFGVFYPLLLGVVIGYGVLLFCLIATGVRLSLSFQDRWEENTSGMMNLFSAGGFFLIFIFVVLDFLYGSPPGFLFVIISILLSRQFLGRAAAFVTNLKSLYAERLVINALFFQGHVLLQETNKQQKQFWHLLEQPRRSEWVTMVVRRLTGVPVADCDIRWLPSGVVDVAMLEAVNRDEHGHIVGTWLIKLFGVTRLALAQHEFHLLSEIGHVDLPIPKFIGAMQVENCLCHLFSFSPKNMPTEKEVGTAVLKLREKLLKIELPADLIRQYKNSRELLWQRISNDMTMRLMIAVNNSEEKLFVDRFSSQLSQIYDHLKKLPLQLINPEMRIGTLWDENYGLVLLHWGQWKLDPLGTDWPLRPYEMNVLKELSTEIISSRSDCSGLLPSHVELAARMSNFELHYLKQNFTEALAMLPDVLATLENITAAEQDTGS